MRPKPPEPLTWSHDHSPLVSPRESSQSVDCITYYYDITTHQSRRGCLRFYPEGTFTVRSGMFPWPPPWDAPLWHPYGFHAAYCRFAFLAHVLYRSPPQGVRVIPSGRDWQLSLLSGQLLLGLSGTNKPIGSSFHCFLTMDPRCPYLRTRRIPLLSYW